MDARDKRGHDENKGVLRSRSEHALRTKDGRTCATVHALCRYEKSQSEPSDSRRSSARLINLWAVPSSIRWSLKKAFSSIAIIWPAMLLRLLVRSTICASSAA
jgi:hypothetical protein